MSFGIPVRNGLAIGLLSSTTLSSRRGLSPAMYLNFLQPFLDSRITFSRGSNATLVDSTGKITYAPANLQPFSAGTWWVGSYGTTATSSNVAVAPDGTTTAELLYPPSNVAQCAIYSDPQPNTLLTIIISVYLKGNGKQWGYLSYGAGGGANTCAWFDLTNGVVGSRGVNVLGSSIEAVGNGWYRCSVRNPIAEARTVVGVSDADNSLSVTANGTNGVYFWGAQLEPVTYQTTPSTYVATTASAYYGPRFDYDPVTLAPKGLLIEEARTNLLTYSEQFDNAAWAKSNATVTANATASPDGTTNAEKLIPTAAATDGRVALFVTGVIGATYTLSVYAKQAEFTNIRLYADDGVSTVASVSYSLATGAITTALNVTGSWTGGSTTITAVGNGWWRLTLTWTATTVAPTRASFWCRDTGNGTSGIYLYGAQLEAGSFATSYIPTVASTVTRSADVATMTGTNFSSWYNQSEGTFVVDSSMLALSTTTSQELLTTDDGTTSNAIFMRSNNTAGSTSATAFTGGVGQGFIDIAGTVAGVPQKVSYGIKLNDAALVRSGGTVGTDVTYAVPTGQIRMGIGTRPAGSAFLNGHIRQIAYYNTRLPNAQLQTLTAPSLATTLSLSFTNQAYTVGV